MNVDEARPVEDRYKIVRQLGEGASAETFLAKDKFNGDRLVAIKSLRVEKIEGWKFFELFEREAKTLATLSHFGIPDFIESFASKDADGRPRFHLVQEFVEGRALSEVIEHGGLTTTEFDQLALGLLDVLDYLHARTPPVFHRDIKPSNIIVRPMGAPVLIDFGSVCYGWREEMDKGSTVAGTHGYMPPEQYLGQVSPRSDLYGLGATLLHLASGRAPSEFSFEEGRLEVPESLPVRENVRRAVSAMLRPAPKDRPSNAREVRKILIQQGTALVPVSSTGLQRSSGSGLVLKQDVNAPRFVDLGAPPRDPNGPFKDAYYTLVPKAMSAAFGVGMSNRQGQKNFFLLYLFAFLCTMGLIPIVVAVSYKERSRRKILFQTGFFKPCTIVGVTTMQQTHARIAYEFEIGDSRYRGSTSAAPTDASHLVNGDILGALYQADDPSNNVLVYE